MSGSTTTTASGGMDLIGVNISGGEYGPTGSGTLGTAYIYPSNAELQYFASKGMTVIRVPFQLERLEPNQGGPLDPSQVADLQQVISEAKALGIDVILDPHNYGSAWGNLIGSAGTPTSSFATFWGDMATAFKGDSNVIYGLMNEPNQQTPTQQAQIDNAAIAAIRQSGAAQEVLVPGTDWTGGWSWISSGNAAAINPSTIHDPLNNYAFEVHQYLDSDASGTHFSPITDPTIGAQRLTAITQWAQQTGAKLFLGEFGVPSDSQSLTAMQNMLSYMEQNSSVWQGATYWCAGQWVGPYPMTIEPTGLGTSNVQDAPQMGVLQQFAPQNTGATPTPAPTATPTPTPPLASTPGNNLIVSTSADDFIPGSAGVSWIQSSGANVGILGNAGDMMYVTMTGSSGLLAANGATVAATVAGSSDTLLGGAGAETVNASSSVLMFGSSGSLAFVGTGGTPTLVGAANASEMVTVGSGGMLFAGASGNNATVTGGTGMATLFGSSNTDIDLNGSEGAAIYVAGAGNETLNARGSSGSNFIVGSFDSAGSDSLAGGSGSDTILAGTGTDSMVMGSGKEAAVFFAANTNGQHDFVADFNPGKDTLWLLGYDPARSAIDLVDNATTNRSGVTLTLSDNTQITFTNLTNANQMDGKIFYS